MFSLNFTPRTVVFNYVDNLNDGEYHMLQSERVFHISKEKNLIWLTLLLYLISYKIGDIKYLQHVYRKKCIDLSLADIVY